MAGTITTPSSRGNITLALLLAFLVAFPKSGFKVGGIPVTTGYVLLACVAAAALIMNLANDRYTTLPRGIGAAYAATLPLQALLIVTAALLPSVDAGNTLSFFVSFVCLPLAIYVFLAPQFATLDTAALGRYLRLCVSFVAVYGIFLFCYVLARKSLFTIPMLTVNAGDTDILDSKNIDRGGGIFKLISTYNNGNIYGVCMLMLLPLYDLYQRSLFWRLLVRLSLLMTLSRTVWFGMLAYELIASVYLRKLTRSTLLLVTLSLACALAAMLYALNWMGHDLSFILDRSLGGRLDNIQIARITLAPGSEISFSSEIMYFSVTSALGLIGLAFFLITMLAPIAMMALGRHHRDPQVRACLVGMLMLMICGVSDGPILLIPVMAFYWGLAAIGLRRRAAHEHDQHGGE